MKKLSIPLSLLLILSLFLSLTVSASADFSASVTLGDKVGEFVEAESGYTRFGDSGITYNDPNGKESLLDFLGNNPFGRSFHNVENVQADLFTLQDYSLLPNMTSLVRPDGTILFENAAIVKTTGNPRYLRVIYATEEVSNKEDCYLFFHESDELFSIRLEPDQGDMMYAGYSLVYDLQEERFVENVRLDDAADYLYFVGDNILVDYAYGSGKEDELYRPDGSQIELPDSYYQGYGVFYTRTEANTYLIYDENLNPITELDFSPTRIYFGGTVFARENEKKEVYELVRADGSAFSSVVFEYAPDEQNGFLVGHNDKDQYAVISQEGKTLISFSDKADYVYPIENGYGLFQVNYKNEDSGILYPDGRVNKLKERMDNDLCELVNNNGKAEVFLLNTAKYVKMDGYVSSVGPMMFSLRDSDGNYGLYSAADGSQLLPQAYRGFSYSNGYLYAKIDSHTYEVYPVSITVD